MIMDFLELSDVRQEAEFFEGYTPLKSILAKKEVKESIAPRLQKLSIEAKESGLPLGQRFVTRKDTKEAMTGSDLLANLAIVQRTLDKSLPYITSDPSKNPMVVAKERPVPDFKDIEIYTTTETEDLLEVKPGSNYKATSFTDAKSTAKIKKYGRTFKITWEAMLNDTLQEFADLRDKLQRSAQRTLWSLFTDAFQADSGFFNNGNKNLSTGALSTANLKTAITLLEKQVDDNGNTLALSAKYLMVPTDLKFTANLLVNPLLVQQLAVSNMESGATAFDLVPIVNPFLTSTTGWYLFCDPAQLEAMIYLTLNNHKGPEIMVKNSDQSALLGSLGTDAGSFLNDTVEYKVRMCTNTVQKYKQAAVYSAGT